MNRFDEALLDVLANAPARPDVETLRRRTRVRRWRRGGAAFALVAVAAAAVLSVAAFASEGSNATRVSVAPTSVPQPSDASWCVPVSRQQAIDRVFATQIKSADIAEAKLTSWRELRALQLPQTQPPAQSPGFSDDALFWVVQVRGSVVAQSGVAQTYDWAVFDVDARTGGVSLTGGGSGASAPYWDRLVDHGGECSGTATTTTPATTSQTGGTTVVTIPGSGTLSASAAQARAAITAAFIVLYDGTLDTTTRASVVRDNAGIAALFDQVLRGPNGAAAKTAVTHVGQIEFTSPTTARLNYTVVTASSVFSGAFGHAVLVDGSWKVTRDTVCAALAAASAPCPA